VPVARQLLSAVTDPRCASPAEFIFESMPVVRAAAASPPVPGRWRKSESLTDAVAVTGAGIMMTGRPRAGFTPSRIRADPPSDHRDRAGPGSGVVRAADART
jgi:hypothetical protein